MAGLTEVANESGGGPALLSAAAPERGRTDRQQGTASGHHLPVDVRYCHRPVTPLPLLGVSVTYQVIDPVTHQAREQTTIACRRRGHPSSPPPSGISWAPVIWCSFRWERQAFSESFGRHPIAGLAAAFSGVAGVFGVNLIITPVDGVLTEITNDAIHLLNLGHSVYLTANLYFSVLSRIVLCIACTIVTERIVEPRLGPYHSNEQTGGTTTQFASPSMDSLIVLIMLIFLVTGLAYGRGARTVTALPEVMTAITKTFSGLGASSFYFWSSASSLHTSTTATLRRSLRSIWPTRSSI